MHRRSGTTLVEVLVAIFVMGIGLISLLTLFPLGALLIARAIHDERCAETGRNAQAISIMLNIRNDATATTLTIAPTTYDLFQNSYPEQIGQPTGLQDAAPLAESYVTLADPVGWYSVPAGNPQDWVGGSPGLVRRRSLASVNAATLPLIRKNVRKFFTNLNDINFDSSTQSPGTPQTSNAGVPPPIFRDSRFSVAYLLQRPMTSEKSVVNSTMIVFDNRPLSLTGTLTLSEYVFQNTSYFDPAKNTITIDYSSTGLPPPIRPGNWILDASVYTPAGTTNATQHGYFYRVVAVTDLTNTVVKFEVQNPLRGFNPPSNPASYQWPLAANGYGYPGTAIVMEGIAEVFEKGPGRVP